MPQLLAIATSPCRSDKAYDGTIWRAREADSEADGFQPWCSALLYGEGGLVYIVLQSGVGARSGLHGSLGNFPRLIRLRHSARWLQGWILMKWFPVEPAALYGAEVSSTGEVVPGGTLLAPDPFLGGGGSRIGTTQVHAAPEVSSITVVPGGTTPALSAPRSGSGRVISGRSLVSPLSAREQVREMMRRPATQFANRLSSRSFAFRSVLQALVHTPAPGSGLAEVDWAKTPVRRQRQKGGTYGGRRATPLVRHRHQWSLGRMLRVQHPS